MNSFCQRLGGVFAEKGSRTGAVHMKYDVVSSRPKQTQQQDTVFKSCGQIPARPEKFADAMAQKAAKAHSEIKVVTTVTISDSGEAKPRSEGVHISVIFEVPPGYKVTCVQMKTADGKSRTVNIDDEDDSAEDRWMKLRNPAGFEVVSVGFQKKSMGHITVPYLMLTQWIKEDVHS